MFRFKTEQKTWLGRREPSVMLRDLAGVFFHLLSSTFHSSHTPVHQETLRVWSEISEKYNCSWFLNWREFIWHWVRKPFAVCIFAGILACRLWRSYRWWRRLSKLESRMDAVSTDSYSFCLGFNTVYKKNIPEGLDGFIVMHLCYSVKWWCNRTSCYSSKINIKYINKKTSRIAPGWKPFQSSWTYLRVSLMLLYHNKSDKQNGSRERNNKNEIYLSTLAMHLNAKPFVK